MHGFNQFNMDGGQNNWTDWNEIQTETVPRFTFSRTNTRRIQYEYKYTLLDLKSFEMINKLDSDLIISSLLL